MDTADFKKKISQIYEISNELGRAFNIDKCTPDGHLLGAIGQIAAKIAYGLEFGSEKDEHNCTWSDGSRRINVQVRCTGRNNIALRQEPEHLIALSIFENGAIRLLYNGPGNLVWKRIQHQKNPQKYASAKILQEAHADIVRGDELPLSEDIFDS